MRRMALPQVHQSTWSQRTCGMGKIWHGFVSLLNWADQGAKTASDTVERTEAV